MAQSTLSPAAPVSPPALAPLPVRAILPWAAFFGVLMLVLLYFVGAEQGALSVFSGESVHEWVHDGRHLLGFPCH
ncbi:CbtB-domain containing protein [Streptomyces pathocidini]|uniref:CbtB-domain containing protein n=1 Tax=Streptomyces pathocidini TaxID=1650571 RepID=A0ABW7UPU0_9ACTN